MNTESTGAPVRPVMIALFFGLLLGVAATLVVPRWLGPRLPAWFRPGNRVEGVVLDKTLDGDRLLLKVRSDDAIFLATFLERWKEVDFLIETDDVVTLEIANVKGERVRVKLDRSKIERRTAQGGAEE